MGAWQCAPTNFVKEPVRSGRRVRPDLLSNAFTPTLPSPVDGEGKRFTAGAWQCAPTNFIERRAGAFGERTLQVRELIVDLGSLVSRYAGGVMCKQAGKLGFPHGTSPREGIPTFDKEFPRLISLSTPAFGLICACLLLLFPALSFAAEVTIAWSHSTDAKVAGYKIYYGPTSREDQFQVDVGKNISVTISNLQAGGAYSFVVITYDSAGRESRYSNKATVSNLKDKDTHFLSIIPSSPPSSPGIPAPPVQEKSSPDTPPGCEFSIFPALHSVASSGGAGAVGISTNLNCPWTAIANVPWVIITSNNSGAGSQVVYYLVKDNPGASSRQGTLTVAGQTFKITQAGRARHALSINKIGTGTGTVTSIPAGMDFETGTLVILSAAPSPNSDFAAWSGRCSGTKPICSITLDSSTAVSAAFKLKTFVIAAGAGSNGSISPSGRVVVNHGGSQKFIFKPNKGYQLGQIKVDGISVGKPEMLLLGNVMSSHRIEAIFLPLR